MTGLARSRLDSGDADVLANIAEDYYVNGQNQDVIASRYNISRSYVSRLLGRAEPSRRRVAERPGDDGLDASPGPSGIG